jgi:hypothetical protein
MRTAFQARLGEIQFSLGHITTDVFDVLPINTPLRIHQIICIEEDGREIITDGDDLIQSKYELWHWLSMQNNVIYIEFSHPGGCTWTFHRGELCIICKHRGTLVWWTAEILKYYNLATFRNFQRLAQSYGQNCFVLSKDEDLVIPNLVSNGWNGKMSR